jgi:hypothetical protein
MKIHLSFATLFCFKLGASLGREAKSTLRAALDEPVAAAATAMAHHKNIKHLRRLQTDWSSDEIVLVNSTLNPALDEPVGKPAGNPHKNSEYLRRLQAETTASVNPPTKPCTSSADIVDYINSITLSGQTLSLTGTTPLDLALQQLVASNALIGVQLSTCFSEDMDRLRQRFAYLALMYSTGKGLSTNWFTNPNECQWFGVSCVGGSTVSQLVLSRRSLLGTIPADVGLWTGLTHISVTSNQLVGSLPSSIGLWTGLTFFDVADNQLTGTVPQEVSQWTFIQVAYFQRNMFSGTMPMI